MVHLKLEAINIASRFKVSSDITNLIFGNFPNAKEGF